jgi:prolyl-tRNA editing enzyme YbaK/EbsC (Cys-tRNA(Pro) deacylase)
MIPQKVSDFLAKHNLLERVVYFIEPLHHVSDALKFGIDPDQIAKSLTFKDYSVSEDDPNGFPAILVLFSGEAKVSSGEFKRTFNMNCKMLDGEQVYKATGFKPGGVCPFGIENKNVKIYFDESMKGKSVVTPSCGEEHSSITLTIQELENVVPFSG